MIRAGQARFEDTGVAEQRNPQREALIRFAAAMDAIGVEYMVSGSTAMNFYAQPRTTRDIDIVVDPRPSDFRNMCKVLTEDFDGDAEVILNELRRGGMFNVLVPEEDVKIDVIIRARDVQPNEAWSRRQTFTLDDQDVKVISPEDLVVAKLYWARSSHSELQLNDVRNLLKEPLDTRYIRRRVVLMGLTDVWREATANE
jgi:predicted nucleotidyltransferase